MNVKEKKSKMRKRSIVGVLVAVLLLTSVSGMPDATVYASNSTYSIPSSAKEFRGHYYKLYEAPKGIGGKKAEQNCEAKGGHLVTITSAKEQVFADSLAEGKECWIGAVHRNNKWCWVTGEKMLFTQELHTYSTGGDCLYMTSDGAWSNYNSVRYYYICEWDTTTENLLPDQVTLSSVKKASSTAVVLSWKKVNAIKGYTVYMKTGKNGSYKKIADIKDKNTTAYIQSKLKKGKTYYFRVRAYKNIYGERSFGELSAEKKITLK